MKAQGVNDYSYSTNLGSSFDTWTLPQPSHMKCNMDTSFFKAQNTTTIESCVRDSRGQIAGNLA